MFPQGQAAAIIRFENGFVLSVEVSFSLNTTKEENCVSLYGTKGGLALTFSDVTMANSTAGYLSDVTFAGPTGFDFSEAFRTEIAHFLAYVKGETACRVPVEDGVELMKILDAVYASAQSGHEAVIS